MDAADSQVNGSVPLSSRARHDTTGMQPIHRMLAIACLLFAAALPASAHVGSPDVFYEGTAGPYLLFVTVRVPQVIPGVAEIEIRSESPDVKAIRVVPLRLAGPGSNLPPTPDLAERSKEDPQFFTASLWLMESGALQVRMQVDGGRGHAELSVPVPSFAQRTLPMQRPLGALLLVLTILLSGSALSIVGAIVREGSLEGGQAPGPSRLRHARRAMIITAVLMAGVLYFGNAWWGAEAAAFGRRVNFFKPPAAALKLVDGHRLEIRAEMPKIDSPFYSQFSLHLSDVIPDHGHLMHLFLLRVPEMDRLWHLHPEPGTGDMFALDLPNVPAGRYQVYADVVDPRGYPWTLVGSIALPQVAGRALSGDDSAWSGAPLSTDSRPDSSTSLLADGGKMIWERPAQALKASVPLVFKFSVQDQNGQPVRDMQPYMGMAGHAEFVRSDLSVFAHVHPAGSISMAALELAQAELPGGASDSGMDAMPGMSMLMTDSGPLPPEVHFPYGFPQPGEYRIFVQIKRPDGVQTGVFDVHVR